MSDSFVGAITLDIEAKIGAKVRSRGKRADRKYLNKNEHVNTILQ
jgi:hypothetical protein